MSKPPRSYSGLLQVGAIHLYQYAHMATLKAGTNFQLWAYRGSALERQNKLINGFVFQVFDPLGTEKYLF